MNVIFMSYRREDTDLFDPSGAPAYAPCTDLYTYLCRHFGKDLVFKDNRVIPVGVRFDEYITQHVEAAQVFLELIGPRWASITDEQGKQRLAQPNDTNNVSELLREKTAVNITKEHGVFDDYRDLLRELTLCMGYSPSRFFLAGQPSHLWAA